MTPRNANEQQNTSEVGLKSRLRIKMIKSFSRRLIFILLEVCELLFLWGMLDSREKSRLNQCSLGNQNRLHI